MNSVELARPEEYHELLVPAIVRMSEMPGYVDCADALLDPGAMQVLTGHIKTMAESDNVFLLIDRAESGTVRGFLLGCIQPQWYSHELEGVQEFLWIEPEHRGGLTLRRLMRRFEVECAARGAAFLKIGVSSGEKVAAFSKLASRMGYHPGGVNFKKCIRR